MNTIVTVSMLATLVSGQDLSAELSGYIETRHTGVFGVGSGTTT